MSVATDRTSLALPIDVLRHIDATIGQANIDADAVLNSPDDRDVYLSAIEDAEGEFKRRVGLNARVTTVGIPGRRETFEQLSYSISGHKLQKGTFTGTWTDYLPEEKRIPLDNQRVLPFDSAEGDAVFFYTGLQGDGDPWQDVTDRENELWAIIDNVGGWFYFHPYELAQYILAELDVGISTVPSFIREMRFAISYRHGVLDRSSSEVSQTALSASLDDSTTGGVAVADVEVLSSGRISDTAILRIGREYVAATYDRDAGEIVIEQRGVRGTGEQQHDAGETVMYVPPEYRKAVASRAAGDAASAARYSDWLPDTEDSLDRDDMIDLLTQDWEDIVGTLGGDA